MELRDIEIFLTLGEELHFGRTAERLHITPSRVSHVIKKQERRLGVQLFERTSRSVRLTPLGAQLRDELLPAHRRILQALDRTAAEGRAEAGELHAGYSTPWCAALLLRAAEALRERHPGWSVRIRETQYSDFYGPLRRGELHMQLAEFPADEPGVVTGPVMFSEPRTLMVPADHPLAAADTVCMEDLAEVPLLRLRGDHLKPLMDFHLPTRTPRGRPIPDGPWSTSWHEIPVLIAAGLGASIVATRAVDYYARPGIVFVPLRDGPTLDYGVLLPADGPAPMVPAFVDLLCSLTGEAPASAG